MMKLTEQQIKLAEQLLISIINRENVVEYNELASRIDPPMFHRNVGREIGEISKLCHELELPFISAKVVSKETMTAGKGFYQFYDMFGIDKQGKNEKELFHLELKKIRESKEWYRLADYLNLKLQLPRPKDEQREIRILPMSRKIEFSDESLEEIQINYFMGGLIHEHGGYYHFREIGMKCPEKSLILFQIDGAIIASGVLKAIEYFDVPKDKIYKGAYVFYAHTIEIFNPIYAEEISTIEPEFKGFSQVKQKVSYQYLGAIQELIKNKQTPLLPEEIPIGEAVGYTEGTKYQITVNAYERNEKARQECINYHGAVCVICEFSFEKVYGEIAKGFIHVHHVVPLHTIGKDYEVDYKKDLIPVCPNCHAMLHRKIDGRYITIEELKNLFKVKILSTTQHKL
ncbi:MAG: putative restriction endonuclease [Anaerocolumna sp.]|jgi:hypothetical protein|nr:putative restriction endonuclease [Anaerocolumna sp.]